MLPGYSQSENTIRFDRSLDGRAALHATAVIEATPPESELVLDFSRVRDVEYIALVTVVLAIARRRGRRVALRGLCEQHVRLLRYLGIDVDRLARREERPLEGAEREFASAAAAAGVQGKAATSA